MVTFNNNYYHAMDREYSPGEDDVFASDVGESFMIKGTAVGSLNSRIFSGANKVEIGLGMLGNMGKKVEEISKEEREELRDLTKLNEIEMSTHADPNLIGFSGMGERGFDERIRKHSIDEVKKVVDFAAETANKGAIVIHTGEWYRPVSEHKKFEEYKNKDPNKDDTVFLLANQEDGSVKMLRKDMKFQVPEIETVNGQQTYKRENGSFKLKEYTWQDAEKEAKEKNEDAGKIFYRKMIEPEINRMKGEAKRYIAHIDELQTKLSKEIPEEEKKIKETLAKIKEDNTIDNQTKDHILKESKEKLSYLKNSEYNIQREIEGYREQAISLQRQAEYNEKELNNFKPVHNYGIQKTADSIAELGIYAMKKSKGKQEKLYISPENLSPENGYGSHPDELREIIKTSRKRMENQLVKDYGYNQKEAAKRSEEHIKATFDIAHANIWRKYFKGSDEEFNKWVVGEAKKLAEEGVVGHIHLSDNLGYSDSHLSLGEGNAPLREFVKEMKKAGINEFISEGGASNFEENKVKAWRHLGAKMSARGAYAGRGFDELPEHHFAQRRSPNFIHGEYAPSNEFKGQPFYSGLPLE